MKKYTPQVTKHLTFLTAIGAVILASGLLMFAIGSGESSLKIGATALGGMMFIICAVCLFAEKKRTLVIDEKKMTIPVGKKKVVVKFADIRSVESKSYRGIKLIAGNCFFYTLKLKDGTKLIFTLCSYGIRAEREIIQIIKQNAK